MQVSIECSNCGAMAKSRRREFSDQVWAVLIAWGEVEANVVDHPICDDCYNELRDILIDRASEYEAALADPSTLQPPAVAASASKASKKAKTTKAPGRTKVAKAKPERRTGRKVAKLAS